MLVALGATAAKSLLGSGFRVSRQRGEFVKSPLARFVTATLHPSAVLRRPSDEERREEMRRLVDDMRRVERALNGGGAKGSGA